MAVHPLTGREELSISSGLIYNVICPMQVDGSQQESKVSLGLCRIDCYFATTGCFRGKERQGDKVTDLS